MNLINHKRRTLWEGLQQLVIIVVFSLLLWFFINVSPIEQAWADTPLLIILMAIFILLIFIISLVSSYKNIFSKNSFKCNLTNSKLECIVPSGVWEAESFSVLINDINKIEIYDDNDGFIRHYILDKNGNKYWLTGRYGNPVEDIINKIMILNSDIEIIKT